MRWFIENAMVDIEVSAPDGYDLEPLVKAMVWCLNWKETHGEWPEAAYSRWSLIDERLS